MGQAIAAYHLICLSFFSIITHSYVIRGISACVNPVTGERPMRRDLREFQTSGPAFDLSIQALDRFQKTDQTDLLSWYEQYPVWNRPSTLSQERCGNP